MKILFVTHTVDPMGGAARSLRELLHAWDDVEADVMLHHLNGAPDDAAVRAFLGPRVRRVFREWLAYDMCYRGQPLVRESPRRHLLFPLLWRASRARFHSFVARQGYDAVHLNSIVLHPLVRADQPFLLHVREILDGAQPRALASAAAATGVVFIDEATRAPFAATPLRASIVLNNPVDMRAVGRLPPDAARRIGGDPAKLTVFAMIGALIPEKGVDLAIDAFRRADLADARLVIVGTGQRDYVARLERQAAGDRRIVFWGGEREIADLYTLADWVVRGESYHCVGRTVYEALYSGCGAIVPGDPASHSFFEYERFKERIAFYRPGDRDELRRVFTERAGKKMMPKKGSSNVTDYAQTLARFVRDAVGKRVV